jgi:hypothetical protein
VVSDTNINYKNNEKKNVNNFENKNSKNNNNNDKKFETVVKNSVRVDNKNNLKKKHCSRCGKHHMNPNKVCNRIVHCTYCDGDDHFMLLIE